MWKHRHSTDVDLFMANDRYKAVVLEETRRRALEQALKTALRPILLEIANGFLKIDCEKGELGILTSANPLAVMEPTDRVAGTAVQIERPATILGRKIHGRMLRNGVFALRDLYDIAASSVLAKDELSLVLQSVSDSDKAMLRSELSSLPPDWAGNPNQSGRRIIDARAPKSLAKEPHQCVRIVLDLLRDDWSYADNIASQRRPSVSSSGLGLNH